MMWRQGFRAWLKSTLFGFHRVFWKSVAGVNQFINPNIAIFRELKGNWLTSRILSRLGTT